MSEPQLSSPAKVTYTLEVDNMEGGTFKYVIKPLDMDVYYMLSSMIKKAKPYEGFVAAIESLKVSGDDPRVLLGDTQKYLKCLTALEEIFMQMIEPANATLKKN